MPSKPKPKVEPKRRWTADEDRVMESIKERYGTLTIPLLIEKMKIALPNRSYCAIRRRWDILSKRYWQINEDKELIDKVNGAHFKTRTDMTLRMMAASISIANRSVRECVDHWFDTLGPCGTEQKWKPEEYNKLSTLLSLYGNDWETISQYFPRRSESALRERSQIIDIVKNIDDDDNKDEIKRLLNLYPSVVKPGESIETLELSSKYSSPMKRPSEQPGATEESELSNKWKIENGGDSILSQIENVNRGIEPSIARIPFPDQILSYSHQPFLYYKSIPNEFVSKRY